MCFIVVVHVEMEKEIHMTKGTRVGVTWTAERTQTNSTRTGDAALTH